VLAWSCFLYENQKLHQVGGVHADLNSNTFI